MALNANSASSTVLGESSNSSDSDPGDGATTIASKIARYAPTDPEEPESSGRTPRNRASSIGSANISSRMSAMHSRDAWGDERTASEREADRAAFLDGTPATEVRERRGSFGAHGEGVSTTPPTSARRPLPTHVERASGEAATGGADHSGWLSKAGERNTAFKRRFFELRGQRLSYFRTQGEEARGSITIAGATIRCSTPPTHGWCSRIHVHPCDTARIYLLETASKDERDQWLAALRLAAEARS